MNLRLFLPVLAFLISMLSVPAQTPGAAPSLVGAWRLISSDAQTADGKVQATLGADPQGLLIYAANGRLSVHLMQKDRPNFVSGDRLQATPDEAKAAFASYLSYFGTYVVDDTAGTVTHQLEGCTFPNWTGAAQKRFFKLEGNRLTLSTAPMICEGREVRLFIVWERIP